MVMGMNTVRLSDEDEILLQELADRYGGRSEAIRAAIRALSGRERRRRALAEFNEAMTAEFGAVSDEAIEAARRRYFS